MRPQTCIYCLRPEPEATFTRVEHVVGQAFGRFEDNFTITDACDECNQVMGDTIELDFARDSIEGLRRFDYGGKRPADYKTLGRRSTRRVEMVDGHPGAVARLKPADEGDKLEVIPERQFGLSLQSEDGPFEWFAAEDLPDRESFQNTRRAESGSRLFIRYLMLTADEAKEVLEQKGYGAYSDLGPASDIDRGERIECRLTAVMSHELLRVIAKIAFNYMARQFGAGIALLPQFNEIRRYVRYGVVPEYFPVVADGGDIMGDERGGAAKRLGHVVTVEVLPAQVVGQVSLHNTARYSVRLSQLTLSTAPGMRSSHFFNVASREIVRLG